MAESERLGASFNIDVSGLKAGLQQANRLIKESNSEFKAAAAGMDDWAHSEEGLTAKLKNLNEVADLQRKKIDALQKEYDDCIANGLDPMSAAAVKMRTDINNEKAAFEKTKSEINKYEKSLDELADTTDEAGDSMEDLGDSAEKASDGFTIAKGAIADLISSGIQALAGACKNAISSIAGLADETREYREDMGKLETAWESAGKSTELATETYKKFYSVLGEEDRSVEAVNHLAKLVDTEEDMSKWTDICAGVWGTFGDSLPIEGLTEAANETAKTGELTGVLTDALNWATTDQAKWNEVLGEGSAAQQAFAKATAEGMNTEDAFKEALASCSDEQERAKLITDTLNGLYSEASENYKENNKSVIEARNAQSDYNDSLAELGEKVEPITTKVKEGFNKILQKVLELVEDVDLEGFGEKIDKAFDSFINDVLPKILDGFNWIKDNGDTIIAVLAGIAAGFAAFKVASLIMSVVSAIKAAGGALALLNTTMLASPITWIAVGVAALVAGIILLIKNWDKVREAGVKAWEWIKGAWESAATWFHDSVIQPIVDFFSGFWDAIKNGAQAAWDFIKSVFSAVFGFYKEYVIDPILNNPFFKILVELAEGCWIAIKRIWEVVSAWFTEKVITPVTNFFTNAWTAIKDKAKAAWDGIVAVWNAVSGWFNDKVISPITSAFDKAWQKLKDGASKAWEGIKNVFSTVASFFGDTFSKAWEKVKAVFSVGGKIFDGIKDGIVSAFKTIVNAIIKGINKVVAVPFNAINKALDTIRNIEFLGISPFKNLLSRISVPEIPLLAKGGVVRQATAAVVGEDGAEAVVPLERNTEWIDKVADKLASKQPKTVVVNQTNNYSQAHSRYELYKSKQQTAAAVRLALQGV